MQECACQWSTRQQLCSPHQQSQARKRLTEETIERQQYLLIYSENHSLPQLKSVSAVDSSEKLEMQRMQNKIGTHFAQ